MSRRNELIRRLLSGLTDSEFENLVRVREEARHIPDPRRKREARSIPTPRRPVPTPRKMGVKQLIRYFENNPIPPYRPVPISSMNIILIYICYWPAGKSVLGETVPQVLSTARGRTQTEGTVSPNTDRPRPVNNIFIFFLLRFKSFRKILLQPPTYVCWRRARSCWCYSKRAIDCKPKQNITTWFLTCNLYYHN